MKDYSILLNQTYLYVKQHPYERINFSKIATILGLSRHTVSKQYLQIEMSDNFDISNYHEDIADKYQRAVAIIKDLEPKEYTTAEYAIMLKITKSVLEEHLNAKGK